MLLKAFTIFARLKKPTPTQVFGEISEIVRANPHKWQEWLGKLVPDEESRRQIKELIIKIWRPRRVNKIKPSGN